MGSAPVVSVVIPAYNAASFLGQAIESSLRQTLSDIEILVVDDGSTDATLEVAERAAVDPRVRVLRMDRNRGVSAARNLAFDAAEGEWIATLDADDWMTDDRLAVLVDAARATGADMVHDDLLLFHPGEPEPYATMTRSTGAVITEITPVDLDRLIDHETGARTSYRLGLTQPILRRAFLDAHRIRYSEELRVGEDYLLYLECVLAGARWVQIPTAHYAYVQHPVSATSCSQLATIEGKLRACERLLARPDLDAPARASLGRYRANLRSLLAYRRVAEPAKARDLRGALLAALRNPRFVARAAGEVPPLVRRRWSYHVRGDRHALDMLPTTDRSTS